MSMRRAFSCMLAWRVFLRKWDLLISEEEYEINQALVSG